MRSAGIGLSGTWAARGGLWDTLQKLMGLLQEKTGADFSLDVIINFHLNKKIFIFQEDDILETGIEFARRAARILDDNKAGDIKILNVNVQLGITDYFVIATGKARPHIKHLYQELKHKLQEETGRRPEVAEGEAEQGWLLLDYEEVIIHLFTDEKRRYYDLEGLWADATVVSI